MKSLLHCQDPSKTEQNFIPANQDHVTTSKPITNQHESTNQSKPKTNHHLKKSANIRKTMKEKYVKIILWE